MQFLKSPIAYSVNLARLTGDAKATLFLGQLIYWTRVGADVIEHEGWIFKTRLEWENETGLSRYEQESARLLLVQKGLIEEFRTGVPLRLSFRVNVSNLGQQFARLIQSDIQDFKLSDLRSNQGLTKILLGPCFAFHRSLVSVTNCVISAIYLSRCMQIGNYLNRFNTNQFSYSRIQKSILEMDWFDVNTQQWKQDTGLTSSQQRSAFQKLSALGLFDLAHQKYPRKKTYIKIRIKALMQRFQALKPECEKSPTDFPPKGKTVGDFSHYCINKQMNKERCQNDIPCTAYKVCQNDTVKNKSSDASRSTAAVNREVSQNEIPYTGYKVYQNGIQKNSDSDLTNNVCQNDIPYTWYKVCQIDTNNPTHQKSPGKSDKNTEKTALLGDISQGQLDEFSIMQRVFLASLHARVYSDKDYSIKTTTTTTTNFTEDKKLSTTENQKTVVVVELNHLVWPEKLFSSDEQSVIAKQLHSLPNDRAQLVLDELVANCRLGKVRQPISWLRRICQLEKNNEFMPELAFGEAQTRAAKQAQIERMANLNARAKHNPSAINKTALTGSKEASISSDAALLGRQKLKELRDSIAKDAQQQKWAKPQFQNVQQGSKNDNSTI